jgi:hypothetical protein
MVFGPFEVPPPASLTSFLWKALFSERAVRPEDDQRALEQFSVWDEIKAVSTPLSATK